jgi:predicted membrane-bound mannosyltransferase
LLFGDSPAALRLPLAIFGTLNIFAIYWLGRSLRYRTAGMLAAGGLKRCTPVMSFFPSRIMGTQLLAIKATFEVIEL